MDLNGGLGDVVTGSKGIFVDSNLASILQSVAGADCNVWAIEASLKAAAICNSPTDSSFKQPVNNDLI